ncbi:uncharacterized protein LOC119265013 [Pygocentrus nattereri]|uniref:uncharacterized protein LOC119265013 n=1 Tax=Pygocentrus nattereri TaxID=42514 RepID=UPI0018913345|nr:uncharacterized protein LOC119265013 [Pygocentrus nattereri]
MATAGFFSCSECGMFSLDPFSTDSHNDSGVCSKCKLVNCLVEKVDKLELRIRGLIRDRQQGSLLAAPGTPGRASTPSTPALEPPQQGEWVTSRRHSRKAKANATAKATASPPVHHAPPVHVSNRFAPLSEAPAEEPVKGTLVIGDSIVRHVKLATPLGAPAARVICLPGARAPDISGNLRLLANRRYSRVVIHVGANDIRLRQSEVTKANIKEVVKQAQTLSEEVICSGPIPMRRGDEAYSRLSSLNRWMSKWCTDNHVGFIDNWLMFEGKPGLLGRDGVHPTRDGAALLSCSIHLETSTMFNLSLCLPTFSQFVDCKTRENKTLDLLCANVKEAYKSTALPPLGLSDHNMVHLNLWYKPMVQRQAVNHKDSEEVVT